MSNDGLLDLDNIYDYRLWIGLYMNRKIKIDVQIIKRDINGKNICIMI